ncbi:MAG: DUF1822 family protein [Calothrix sp. C42_A2020_038]|nr:DUF1822 family protein [Calothrix sp. C42_A2020_038]
MNQNTPLSEYLDWQSLGNTSVQLAPEQIRRAAQLSLSITYPQQCWHVYRCALGVIGFEQWLSERSPDLQVQVNQSSIWQPAYANLLSAASNIQVGAFKICIITASQVGDLHSIPLAVLDVASLTAHFYVLMQVEEELQQVSVFGFTSYGELQSQRNKLQVEEWNYCLPTNKLNFDPDALLLNLRCLDTSAIELPVSTVQTDLTTNLQQKLANLQSGFKQHPAQFLTLPEVRVLFSNSDFINRLYALTHVQPQPLVNIGLWLRNQIDTVASELGWMLMPTLAPSAMRNFDDFKRIRDGLEARKIYIPSTARGASRELKSECGGVKLYAIVWKLDENPNPEWMMLITLGCIADIPMPKTLRLQVRDQTQELFNQYQEDTTNGILYAKVIGDSNDRFWITVTADDTAVFELPPFGMGS